MRTYDMIDSIGITNKLVQRSNPGRNAVGPRHVSIPLPARYNLA